MPKVTAFLEDNAIKVDVTLIGKCDNWNGEAIIDTGFFGGVAVPVNVACKLGLDHVGAGQILVADGSVVTVDIFTGGIRIGPVVMDDVSYIVLGDEVVLGMEVLKNFNMNYDATRQVLELEYVGPPTVKRRIKIPIESKVEERSELKNSLERLVRIVRRLR